MKIIRSDGYYVFWQSSGLEDKNLQNVEGDVKVLFKFDPNYLCGGEYLITVYCSNGWDLENNYPYKRIYFQKVDVSKFAVIREFPELGFGQLNMRVPVEYRLGTLDKDLSKE